MAMAGEVGSTSICPISYGIGTPGTTAGISIGCSRATGLDSWRPSSPSSLAMAIPIKAMKSADGKQ